MGGGGREQQDPSTAVELIDELEAIVRLLKTSWSEDLFPLRVSALEYQRLVPVLSRYRGLLIVQQWYRAYLLAGCRRVVDQGHDAISMTKAVRRLLNVSDDVTAGEIADLRLRLGVPARHATVDRVEDDLERFLPRHVRGGVIGRRAVQADLDRVKGMARRVENIATHDVAHRLDKPAPASVTADEVEVLLADLFAIYRRWSVVLRATDIAEIRDQRLLTRVTRALELFDLETYVDAVSEEWGRGGPATTESWKDVEARVRIDYHFDPSPKSGPGTS